MDKMLVHICCGVDAVWAIRKLKEQFPDTKIKGFFYDPNIHPEEEYELRWIETKRVCDSLDIDCIKGEYDLENWLNQVKGYENEPERGERCSICHDIRLEKTAKVAKELGFNKITTVLLMSPKKDFQVLKQIGEHIAQKYGIQFQSVEFRKGGGIEMMNKLSKQQQLYHQNYCGCIYGLFKQRQGLDIITELVSFGKGRLAGSREELLFIKQIRSFCENLGVSCKEQTFSFINWKLISSIMKIQKQPVYHTLLPYSSPIKGILRAKIESIIEKADKYIYKLNKTDTQIWKLKKELKEIPLKEPRILTNPVFIVGKDTNLEIGQKIELQLKTEFDASAKSQNLIIGDIKSPNKIFFHSDTLPDGTMGADLKEIISCIKQNEEPLKRGSICIVVLGASTVGNLGKRAFLEYTELESNL
ncbi:MAG: epoxyqueuosine reductase QueH [Aquificae bacterium]|nr:epoxyqueuosine reductase QueH [Aquificota bacterium]